MEWELSQYVYAIVLDTYNFSLSQFNIVHQGHIVGQHIPTMPHPYPTRQPHRACHELEVDSRPVGSEHVFLREEKEGEKKEKRKRDQKNIRDCVQC